MEYEIVESGSKGNAIIINDFFLLDCGVPYKKIKPYLHKIKLVFISHIHTDHLKKATIKKIIYNKPNIRFVCGSTDIVRELVEDCGVPKANVYALVSNKTYDLGAIKIRLEPVHHDVPNHLCKFTINNEQGIYAVDTNNLDGVVAKNYNLYLIEANYMEDLLDKNEKEDEENQIYYERVKNVHLSYEKCNEFLINNMGKNSKYCYIHKSTKNFNEEEKL